MMKPIGSSVTHISDFFPGLESKDSFFGNVEKHSFKNLIFSEDDYYRLLSHSNIRTDDYTLVKNQDFFDFKHIDRALNETLISKKIDFEKQKIIKQKILEGYSLKIFDIDQYHFSLEKLARSFRTLFEANISLNSYYTPVKNRCFHPHRDNYPIIIFQIFGKKEWMIEKTNSTNEENVDIEKIEFDTFVLNEGEAIILPANYLHQCQTLDSDSMHLTLGIHEINKATFINDLLLYKSDFEINLPKKNSAFFKGEQIHQNGGISFDKGEQYKFEITFLQFHYASFLNRNLFAYKNYSSTNINYDELKNSHEWFYYDEEEKIILTRGAEVFSNLSKELTSKIMLLDNFNLKGFVGSLKASDQVNALQLIRSLAKVGYFS